MSFLALVAIVLLDGCACSPRPPSPSVIQGPHGQAPDWYLEPPTSSNFVYGVGKGTAPDARAALAAAEYVALAQAASVLGISSERSAQDSLGVLADQDRTAVVLQAAVDRAIHDGGRLETGVVNVEADGYTAYALVAVPTPEPRLVRGGRSHALRKQATPDDTTIRAGAVSDVVPRFPWPPPTPSASVSVPLSQLCEAVGGSSLGDIATSIERSFRSCGYGGPSWYVIPGGVAAVSRLEQINDDGSPKAGEDRWRLSVSPPASFSLGAYLKSLVTATKGRYRIVVVLVSASPFYVESREASVVEASAWYSRGMPTLPRPMAEAPLLPDDMCSVLIYEFERPTSDDEPKICVPATILVEDHLRKGGLWSCLGGEKTFGQCP